MAQVVSRRPLVIWMWVKSEINTRKICGGHSSFGEDSSRILRLPLSVPFHHFSIPTQFSFASIIPSFLCPRSIFPCQYHSTISPYSLGIPLSAFFTIFPSSFCVPLSASFHHCSILTFIHLSTTLISLHY
jgi:hypothetical protein